MRYLLGSLFRECDRKKCRIFELNKNALGTQSWSAEICVEVTYGLNLRYRKKFSTVVLSSALILKSAQNQIELNSRSMSINSMSGTLDKKIPCIGENSILLGMVYTKWLAEHLRLIDVIQTDLKIVVKELGNFKSKCSGRNMQAIS